MKSYLLAFALLVGVGVTAVAAAETPTPEALAALRMKERGISEEFIRELQGSYDSSIREKVVQLNVLGFVGKADYSGHYSDRAVRKTNAFMRKYARSLRNAKREYGVSPEVIASLLWVETKYGKVMGRMPVADVYFSLIQADHPVMVESSLKALAEKVAPAAVEPAQETKARERSVTKAQWALGELQALASLHGDKVKNVRKLKGSFAGAFGFPQFIPSSYAQWARSPAGRGVGKPKAPNLFKMEDAIHSVAHYLSSNGWKPGDAESHQAALHHYNRAQGYVDVILKLAEANGFKRGRALASVSTPLPSPSSSPAPAH